MKSFRWLGFVVCFIACAVLGAERGSSYKTLGPEEFAKVQVETKGVVLDVRTPAEFASGHINGAINLDWNGENFATKAAALDKSKIYLVYCASGTRSARACAKMSQLGFNRLHNLQGGIRAWQKAGQPVDK